MSFLRRRARLISTIDAKSPPPFDPDEEKTATPSDLPWTGRRHLLVERALEKEDMAALRKISAMPGGFGSDEMRRRVWPFLLGTQRFFPGSPSRSDEPKTSQVPDTEEPGDGGGIIERARSIVTSGAAFHPDESQVSLDTKRSFVSYPKGLPADGKLGMQADLQGLVVDVLRKYPRLSYFQGYHDIMSVLYLTLVPSTPLEPRSRTASLDRKKRVTVLNVSTAVDRSGSEKGSEPGRHDGEGWNDHVAPADLPPPYLANSRDTPEWGTLRRCAEVVSLCRVRDAMGKGLEPMMGLLRILKRLLKAADPELARFSSTISPVPSLPFFALSWILCLFSHDIDTLEPIQRMFDFLLARNPISAIYLAVAILVAKKPQMLELAKKLGSEAEDDPSLLHPLFARLPPLYPDTPDLAHPPSGLGGTSDEDDPNAYRPIPLGQLFSLADDLMEKWPWDGEVIRSKEIMGEGSVVCTYELESRGSRWNLRGALDCIDQDVVKPGAGATDDEVEEVPIRRRPAGRVRVPRNKLGTTVALGMLILGLSMAILGVGAGGPRSDWARWWVMVVRTWGGKSEKLGVTEGYSRLIGYVGRTMRDLL